MPASDRTRDLPSLTFRATLLLFAVHAAILLIAFSVPALGPLAVAAPLAALIAAWRAATLRHILVAALLTHVPLWFVLCGWMLGVSLPAGVFFAPIMSLLFLLPVPVMRPLLRGGWFARQSAVLTVPVVYGACELFRAELFLGGYPWFLSAHPLAFYPVLVQTADLFGASFVGMLAVIPAAVAFDVLRMRSGTLAARHVHIAAAAAMLVLFAALLYGTVRVLETPRMTTAGPVLVAVQTDLTEMKSRRTMDQQVDDFRRFVDLTIRAMESAEARGIRPDLFIWPETMLPGIGLEPGPITAMAEEGFEWPERFASWTLMLREIIGAPLMIGSAVVTEIDVTPERIEFLRRFNSVYLVDDGAPPFARYDKVALTPFGERIPWIGGIPAVRRAMIAIGAPGMLFDLDAGTRLDPLGPIGEESAYLATPVCFESTVASVCRIMVWGERGEARRASAIVNVSNDGWFGRSRMARRHFVEICRLRSIETRSDLVRAANTGYSVHIDSAGKLVGAAGNGRYGTAMEGGWLVAPIREDRRRPFYAGAGRHFPVPVFLLAALVTAVHLRSRRGVPAQP